MRPAARSLKTAALTAVLAIALAISGCTLSSETNLVDPSEGEAVFEEAVVFGTYEENDDGVFILAEDGPPGDFTYTGGGYVAPDGSMTVYFLPAPDGGDYMMLAILSGDGAMYGTAHRTPDGITELRVLFSDDLDSMAGALPPGAELIDGGIRVSNRADLDAIIPLIADGTLPTSPLIAYLGGDAPPPTVVRDGTSYRPGS